MDTNYSTVSLSTTDNPMGNTGNNKKASSVFINVIIILINLFFCLILDQFLLFL